MKKLLALCLISLLVQPCFAQNGSIQSKQKVCLARDNEDILACPSRGLLLFIPVLPGGELHPLYIAAKYCDLKKEVLVTPDGVLCTKGMTRPVIRPNGELAYKDADGSSDEKAKENQSSDSKSKPSALGPLGEALSSAIAPLQDQSLAKNAPLNVAGIKSCVSRWYKLESPNKPKKGQFVGTWSVRFSRSGYFLEPKQIKKSDSPNFDLGIYSALNYCGREFEKIPHETEYTVDFDAVDYLEKNK